MEGIDEGPNKGSRDGFVEGSFERLDECDPVMLGYIDGPNEGLGVGT